LVSFKLFHFIVRKISDRFVKKLCQPMVAKKKLLQLSVQEVRLQPIHSLKALLEYQKALGKVAADRTWPVPD
jgi:cobalamin biosynthesis Co2+ chelatase CbiK